MGHFFQKVVFLGIYLYLLWWNLEKIRWGEEGIELSIIECVRDRNRMKEIERGAAKAAEGGHSLSAQMEVA